MKTIYNWYLSVCIFFYSYAANSASGGIDKVNTIMETVQSTLEKVSAVSITVAILWGGYKILFGGQTFREAAPILIGGITLGAATGIASIFVN